MGDVDHGPFIESAQEFKRQLVGGGFTPDEIAAMLGTYVLTTYQQHLNQQLPSSTRCSPSRTASPT